jgi:uncharacterized membrane protein
MIRIGNFRRQSGPWLIPLLYASASIAVGLTFPRIERQLFPHLLSDLSVATATAIYSSIASGMIALTGIVFSLSFVMIQFSATAYSPRLVLWLARDRVVSHALGIFTATFIFAISALAGVDRNGNGKVPFISAWVEIALLLASVVMLVALVYRIGRLQVNRMLEFTADQGRRATRALYQSLPADTGVGPAPQFDEGYRTQVMVHRGRPKAVQAIDIQGLVRLADASNAVIVFAAAVGDTMMEGMTLLSVFAAPAPIGEFKLRRRVALGNERTFEQDPKYALRILVDIAIRGLSPAVNDPTTAVQALDQIGDLLLRLGHCPSLETGVFRGKDGRVRLVVPFPAWEDLVNLALNEILFYGASSVQVTRRLTALIADLISLLPENRHAVLRVAQARLQASIARIFSEDPQERLAAGVEDRQGLGLVHRGPGLPTERRTAANEEKPKSA